LDEAEASHPEQKRRPAAEQAPERSGCLRDPAVHDHEGGQGGERQQRAGGGVRSELTAVEQGLDQQHGAGHHGQAAKQAGNGDTPAAAGQRDDADANRGEKELDRQQRHCGRVPDGRRTRLFERG